MTRICHNASGGKGKGKGKGNGGVEGLPGEAGEACRAHWDPKAERVVGFINTQLWGNKNPCSDREVIVLGILSKYTVSAKVLTGKASAWT